MLYIELDMTSQNLSIIDLVDGTSTARRQTVAKPMLTYHESEPK